MTLDSVGIGGKFRMKPFFSTGNFSRLRKVARVAPIIKKGKNEDSVNEKATSVLPFLSKIFNKKGL